MTSGLRSGLPVPHSGVPPSHTAPVSLPSKLGVQRGWGAESRGRFTSGRYRPQCQRSPVSSGSVLSRPRRQPTPVPSGESVRTLPSSHHKRRRTSRPPVKSNHWDPQDPRHRSRPVRLVTGVGTSDWTPSCSGLNRSLYVEASRLRPRHSHSDSQSDDRTTTLSLCSRVTD